MGFIVNILVLGATGMLGNAVFQILSEDYGLKVFGTVRQREKTLFHR
jgi:nucleoside-diphosphate-sugar epimerase